MPPTAAGHQLCSRKSCCFTWKALTLPHSRKSSSAPESWPYSPSWETVSLFLSKLHIGFFFFLMEDNCFTMFCWSPLHNDRNQPQVYIHTLPLGPPFQPLPILLLEVVTEPQVELLVLYSNFTLATYYQHGITYVPLLLSQKPSHPLPTPLCPQVFPYPIMSASPFLLCRQVHQKHLSTFHIYALIYICFSLSDLLQSL